MNNIKPEKKLFRVNSDRKDKRSGSEAQSSVAGGSGICHGSVKSKVLHG
ncbi:MAG: hypothetical protein ACI8PB_000038 [Desulforhopalus sp.]|jgi:hypothetical protein